MLRRHTFVRFLSLLVALCGLVAVAAASRADTPIYAADVRGLYIGSQTSSYSGLNPFLVIDITDQSSYWDTGGGAHNPWSHVNGTISINFGPSIAFSGTVRYGGRMDISYWYWDGSGWQNGSYTAYIMNSGYTYETTGGTYTTTEWLYLPFFGWLTYRSDAGSFYVFRW